MPHDLNPNPAFFLNTDPGLNPDPAVSKLMKLLKSKIKVKSRYSTTKFFFISYLLVIKNKKKIKLQRRNNFFSFSPLDPDPHP
jgi:hypothetical protein